MKKILLSMVTCYLLLVTCSNTSFAQQLKPDNTTTNYFKGEVVNVVKEGEKSIGGLQNFTQELQVKLTEGPDSGKIVSVENGGMIKILESQKVQAGDEVVIQQTQNGKQTTYSLFDRYRLSSIIFITLFFFVLVIGIAGKKGLGSIIGMLVSLLVILKFIVPQILSGNDPLFISIIGSIIIMFLTLYLAHGFSKKTHVALIATILSLTITGFLAVFFVNLSHLSGLGNEDTYLLQFGGLNINLQGILLGGIIIGVLGILDDSTTAQSATIFELFDANNKLTFAHLLKRGMVIGKEHIASLVNTLVLAYAGTALGIFILLEVNPAHQPMWVILNSEVIVEEVVRTLAGSIGLVLAVPITTLIAVFFCKYKLKFI